MHFTRGSSRFILIFYFTRNVHVYVIDVLWYLSVTLLNTFMHNDQEKNLSSYAIRTVSEIMNRRETFLWLLIFTSLKFLL